MTYEETQRILDLLRVNYPQSFRNMTKDEAKAFLSLWSSAFAEIPLFLVKRAVTIIIMENEREFAPNVGQVNSQIKKMLLPNTQEEAVKAWDTIIQFIHDYHQDDYYEHYKDLPERIRRSIKTQDIRMIANSTDGTTRSVERTNFLKRYAAIKEEEESDAISTGNLLQLVDPIRALALGIPQALAIENKEKNNDA